MPRTWGWARVPCNRLCNNEGTSFQALLDAARRQQTEHYLRESDRQMSQMAALLGYVELSSFSRAFSRWFGCSPRQWLSAQGPTPRRWRMRGRG
ncbi:hypothetical protein CD175_14690 [Pseudomonas laurylsulfatiphila]|uniref:HTH araC/xylS-type domain-containing protein n=1 Tax=Pseudomonas laurylsulfatiphila TaxID=2011015 RepID=A0A2S6FJE7_9PSED|nr:hypothetical protein CD175_14690 [Pseudomonas laurylsulfatiphila]